MENHVQNGLQSIKININNYKYDKFTTGSQYMIKGIASLLNY